MEKAIGDGEDAAADGEDLGGDVGGGEKTVGEEVES